MSNSKADVLEEFLRSYGESYFGLVVRDKVHPAYIAQTRTAARGFLPLAYMVDPQGNTLSKDLNWTTERDQLERNYPDLGCVKIGPTFAFLRVRPIRQFKKGYYPSNVEMFSPNQTQVKRHVPRFAPSPFAKDVVWQIYNPEYWHPMEAVRLMDAGEGVGYPLSKNFGLYADSDHPNLIIVHKNHSVGTFTEGRFTLFPNFKILKEQFQRETQVEAF